MSDAWRHLEAELDAWAGAGQRAQVWWRDDDAVAPSPALARLLELAAAHGTPLSLAVIPAAAEAGLVDLLADHRARTAVLQHGFAHENHAGPAAKKCELLSPTERPAVIDELLRGRDILRRLFPRRFRPVLVPPWNRVAAALVPRLPDLGFTGLSTYTNRASAEAAHGLVQVNCHLDLMRWRPERAFLGTEAALALLTGHLSAKRQGRADAAEPSGILSHHLVHDAAAWEFLDRLLTLLGSHPAVCLLTAEQAFDPTPAGTAAPEGAR